MLAIFERSAMARVLSVVGVMVVIAVAVIWNMVTPAEHSIFLLKLAGWIGVALPTIVLGAIWGWIRYSKSAWLWATLTFATLTIALLFHNPNVAP
jgi:hypothetical protein